MLFNLVNSLDVIVPISDIHDHSSSASVVETNESVTVDSVDDRLEDLKLTATSMPQQKLSKKQKRRQNQKQQQAINIMKPSVLSESNISTEPKASAEQTVLTTANASAESVIKAVTTLNFDQLKIRPRKSINIIQGQKMACNDKYFLVCPKNKLALLDAEGKEHFNVHRNFEVYDICWSTYLKRFLILSEKDLYSLDLTRQTPLMIEIAQFTRDMDECTCYDNIFMMISDYGGAVIEVWDMKLQWKVIKFYKQPESCKKGQGICTIKFSSNGMHLGVTLTEPRIGKAYFQLRNWQDMKVLKVVELPFYEGFCNHYILALPSEKFLIHKYSEKEMFLFDSNGQQKQIIRYAKGICSVALLTNDKNCLAVQTSQPDELHFHDI